MKIRQIREDFDEYEGLDDTDQFRNGPHLPPSPEELDIADQQALLTWDITKVEQIGDEWRDDHIECIAVRIHTGDRQIDTSLWWCGPTIIGAIKYADESPRAMADLMRELQNHIQNDLE